MTSQFDAAVEYLAEAADAGLNGVVILSRGDQILLEEAWGWADADLRVPLRPDHALRIGSLTKPVTAAAVLIAVDRGLLRLDDRLCDRLQQCPEAWSTVTVRHLLTHTSGIPDLFGDLEAVPVADTSTELRRVLETLGPTEGLSAAPGTEYAYSNFNYVLLGALLEVATGRGWPEVIRDWIAEPLGLRSVRYDDVFAVVPDRVRGYRRDPDLGLRNIEYEDHAAYAAGGLLASGPELQKLFLQSLSGQLFAPSLARAAVSPSIGTYGYGWQVRRFFDRPVFNHTGGIDGFSSHVAFYPDEDSLMVVVLTNVENDDAILRACDIAARLFDWPVRYEVGEPPPEPRDRCGVSD